MFRIIETLDSACLQCMHWLYLFCRSSNIFVPRHVRLIMSFATRFWCPHHCVASGTKSHRAFSLHIRCFSVFSLTDRAAFLCRPSCPCDTVLPSRSNYLTPLLYVRVHHASYQTDLCIPPLHRVRSLFSYSRERFGPGIYASQGGYHIFVCHRRQKLPSRRHAISNRRQCRSQTHRVLVPISMSTTTIIQRRKKVPGRGYDPYRQCGHTSKDDF